jgi:hypothetical protein
VLVSLVSAASLCGLTNGEPPGDLPGRRDEEMLV